MNGLLTESVYKNLPELLQTLTEGFTGRERDVVLLSSLGVLSCCIPKVYGIYDGSRVSSHLYTLIIAPPASGKGKMGLSQLLIDKIHNKIKFDSKLAIDECKSENKGKEYLCPKLEVKLIPGNTSSKRVYSHLNTSKDGVLIHESEADTLSKMFSQEWGDFSDVLRKAFHGERLSLSRDSDDEFMEIESPKLSVVLSGTRNQITPLLKSRENGLFSRFIYYYFNEGSHWKNVAPTSDDKDYKSIFLSVGDTIYDVYGSLINAEEVKFDLSADQWKKLDYTFRVANDDFFIANGNLGFTSNTKRLGLILFRLSMILSVIRNYKTVHEKSGLECQDVDFEIALGIVKCVMDHALKVFDLFESDGLGLSTYDYNFLRCLPKEFARKKAIEIGTELGIPERTVGYKLKKWSDERKILEKVSNGNYKKLKMK